MVSRLVLLQKTDRTDRHVAAVAEFHHCLHCLSLYHHRPIAENLSGSDLRKGWNRSAIRCHYCAEEATARGTGNIPPQHGISIPRSIVLPARCQRQRRHMSGSEESSTPAMDRWTFTGMTRWLPAGVRRFGDVPHLAGMKDGWGGRVETTSPAMTASSGASPRSA